MEMYEYFHDMGMFKYFHDIFGNAWVFSRFIIIWNYMLYLHRILILEFHFINFYC